MRRPKHQKSFGASFTRLDFARMMVVLVGIFAAAGLARGLGAENFVVQLIFGVAGAGIAGMAFDLATSWRQPERRRNANHP